MSLLSLLFDVNVWWIKALDFPRVQFLLVGLLCLLMFGVLNQRWSFWAAFLTVGLISSIGLQLYFIIPYTSLVQKTVKTFNTQDINKSNKVKLLVANVYMHNRQATSFLDIVKQTEPDMVLVMETNQWWIKALQPLRKKYAYYHEYPADNTYGMGLYSNFPLLDLETKFLQHSDVPSFHTKVQLPSGNTFLFHGVHPVPPVLSKHPDNKGEQEIALIKVGRMVAQNNIPSIVAGDFNDVAWSNTSRLFQTTGELNDIRVGRGLYNSFDANSPMLRWPLDHVYVTERFELKHLERLGKFGSDHFPIYAELVLTSGK
ncbi:endonuclease/exonuclease/phosphatase (EEP) superfamily protein YafD [Catalinimonas alkaloidigena]|uniref:endonuclease/exonuclease/phosphatase family protein n=1 Tax=Catalinimonas alkaloidigena TaxID=1075417 RepID=UPI0024052FCF|nr:endonuclease/exonuclease/phosphatase family protein [Catalinimonas alkaloidigena]MDF9801265.1 endonuclease/exonuclease/phosphatase (EEP) superfamily protein YafD [Catalinimonas alkaloidigena]